MHDDRGDRRTGGRRYEREARQDVRKIRTLYNYDPPVSEEEIRAAALPFVRKISGFMG